MNATNYMPIGKKKENIAALADIKSKFPGAGFVYFRRLGSSFKGDVVDFPMKQALWAINQFPEWELLMSSQQMDEEVQALFEDEILADLGEAHDNAAELLGPTNNAAMTGIGKGESMLPPLPETISDNEFESIMNGDIDAIDESEMHTPDGLARMTVSPFETGAIAIKKADLLTGAPTPLAKKTESAAIAALTCGTCEYVAASKAGLTIHKKRHTK